MSREHLAHVLAHVLVDDPRADGVRAVLGRVRDRVVHALDAALVDQVDDQLHLVQALVVGELRRVAGLDERLEAELDQLREPAAEHGLLAEQVGLGLVLEGRLDDPGAAGADRGGVGERELARVAARVLRDGDQRRRAVALLEDAADDVAGALRRAHDHVVRRRPARSGRSGSRSRGRRAARRRARRFGATSSRKSAACEPSGTRNATSCASRTASGTSVTVRPASSAAARDELSGPQPDLDRRCRSPRG